MAKEVKRMGKTLAEKILSTHSNTDRYAGEFVIANVDYVFCTDGNRPQPLEVFYKMGGNKVFNPSKVAQIIDHAPSSPTESTALIHNKMSEFAQKQGLRMYEAGEGNSHQLNPERGEVIPGQLVVGADSHTCTYGAINAFATGVGSSDLAATMISGKLWFKIPETIKLILKGKLPAGVYSKDLILYLIGEFGAKGALYKAVEFTGEAIDALTIDARFTISNMVVEMGAKAGLMNIDGRAASWIRKHSNKEWKAVFADEDAQYAKVIELDVSKISPQIAKPHTVDNTASVEQVEGTVINEAIVGTCTNGRLEDLRIIARVLQGRKIHPRVRMYITPASRRVYKSALREGLVEIFLDAGATILVPGCSGCVGGSYCGCPRDGENVITSANRNFKGRLGNPKANIYLASPATVATSALEGKITDCRKYF